jgi:membrane protein
MAIASSLAASFLKNNAPGEPHAKPLRQSTALRAAVRPVRSETRSQADAPQHSQKQKADKPSAAVGSRSDGKDAETPAKIPAQGWWQIAKRTYQEFTSDHVTSVAAGVTYFVLLAIFPAIAALVSIYGLFADPATIGSHVQSLSSVLPGGAVEIVGEQINRITSSGEGALGFAFFFGILTALWSANAGVKALFEALNIIYEEDEKRGFIRLNLTSLAFTLGGIGFVLLALGAIVVLPIVFDFIGMASTVEWLIAIGRWPILLIALGLGLSLIYRFGPSRDEPKWRWVTPGGVIAAFLWLVASLLFSWYAANFGSYNETYGTLGAVIGLLTWIWISSIIILLGAEINAESEHQTAADTTKGPPRPLGARGAEMADKVAS